MNTVIMADLSDVVVMRDWCENNKSDLNIFNSPNENKLSLWLRTRNSQTASESMHISLVKYNKDNIYMVKISHKEKDLGCFVLNISSMNNIKIVTYKIGEEEWDTGEIPKLLKNHVLSVIYSCYHYINCPDKYTVIKENSAEEEPQFIALTS